MSTNRTIIDQLPPIEGATLVHTLGLVVLNTVKPEGPPMTASCSGLPSHPGLEQLIQANVDEAVRGHIRALTRADHDQAKPQ